MGLFYSVAMGLQQVWLGLVVLAMLKLSMAQRPGLEKIKIPAGFQPNLPVQITVAGMPSQQSQLAQSPPELQLQNPVLSSVNVQSHQIIQGPVKPLNWRFPIMPQIPRPTPVHVNRPVPVPARTVAALCSENAVYVEVKKDLFGTGEPIDVSALSLGGCVAKGEDPALQVLIFESELQGCNSKLIMTDDELVYVFNLIYGSPERRTNDFPIVRSVAAVGTAVAIECHYPRLHNVSSSALFPVWVPYASAQAAAELLVFSLRLMMDDWVSERASNQYYLGEVINVEVSVMQYYHVPLRVYVDSCVATAVPDLSAVPRYSFIDNYGCLADTKFTGSKSRFLPQTQGNKLVFQLETFRFQQVNSSMIYIACFLKATAASFTPNAEHKACSFSGDGWVAAYGDSGVCNCCDRSCSARKARDLDSVEDLQLKGKVTLGPILVEEMEYP